MSEKSFTKYGSDVGDGVAFITEKIGRICGFKPRAAGSDGEKKAAAYMKGVLLNECGCRHAVTEGFTVAPDSFNGVFRLFSALTLFCYFSAFLSAWLCLFFGVAAVFSVFARYVFEFPLTDRFYKKRESVNITAVRPCAEAVKRRVFLCGHIDAAKEWRLNYRPGGVWVFLPLVLSLFGIVYFATLSGLRIADITLREGALAPGLLFVPFPILQFFFINGKRTVDGANDDLSGCLIAAAALRDLERKKRVFKNTEVGVILTGAEENGLSGAKAWSKRHRGDYRDVPTYIIVLDTIHDPEKLCVNLKEQNGRIKSCLPLCKLFLRAAKEVGAPCKAGKMAFLEGATDAAAFLEGGFDAISVTGCRHSPERYYHTRRDTAKNLNNRGLENCLAAVIKTLEMIDAEEK